MIQILLYSSLFIIGIILLCKSADLLVDGASKMAAKLGISSLIISLTIVAYGTSAPESFVSFLAALGGYDGIALGNVIGSCIANLLLVLGVSALIKPLKVKKTFLKREMPILIGVVLLLMVVSIRGILDWIVGIILLVVFVYITFLVGLAKRERDINNTHIKENKKQSNILSKNILFIILGMVGVIVGSEFLIRSSIFISNALEIPEVIIALSMVAIGTSLPELAVSSVASYKNEFDISLGNLIGSNIFNITLILGICSLILPIHVEMISLLTTIFLLCVSLVIFLVVYTRYSVSRKAGAILLAVYFIYFLHLFHIS